MIREFRRPRRFNVTNELRDRVRASLLRLGRELRTARADDSQTAVANRAGLWQDTVSHLERGQCGANISLDAFTRVADACGLSVVLVPRTDVAVTTYREEKLAAEERRRAKQLDVFGAAKAEYDAYVARRKVV